MKKIIILIFIVVVYLTIFYKPNINVLINNDIKKLSNDELRILEKYDYLPNHQCNKVTVLESENKIGGKFNLEDYVAGVVSGETHVLDNEELFKTMSIAIRTYTLYVTNNCKYPIINSEANQVMDNPKIVSKKIKKAVAATKGMVLTLDNKLVKAEYDSFYMGNGFYCNYKYCYSNYLKVGNKDTKAKTHKIKVPATWKSDLSGGHGKGLSQYGALYLSRQGYKYDYILKYFYADGTKISTIIKPNVDGLKYNENGYISRETRPLRNNKYYYTNNLANNLEGSSSWYTTSRANEILKSLGSNKQLAYMKEENYCNINNFNVSFNYLDMKEGSIISWGPHTAIIEKVNKDKSIDITESYIGLGYYGIEMANEKLVEGGLFYNKNTNQSDRKYNCENNKSGCFHKITLSLDKIINRWGYKFKCYVYLKN